MTAETGLGHSSHSPSTLCSTRFTRKIKASESILFVSELMMRIATPKFPDAFEAVMIREKTEASCFVGSAHPRPALRTDQFSSKHSHEIKRVTVRPFLPKEMTNR